MNNRNNGTSLKKSILKIIVLFILLVIICAKMFFGENGILQKATGEREFRDGDNVYMQMYRNGYLDESGEIVPIPKGFYYVGGTLNTGVVISDNEKDKNKYKQEENVGTDLEGNQWVWVPVNSTIGNNNMYTTLEIEDYVKLTNEEEINGVTTFKYSTFYNFYDSNHKEILENHYMKEYYKNILQENENINTSINSEETVNREPDILNYEIYEEKNNLRKNICKRNE